MPRTATAASADTSFCILLRPNGRSFPSSTSIVHNSVKCRLIPLHVCNLWIDLLRQRICFIISFPDPDSLLIPIPCAFWSIFSQVGVIFTRIALHELDLQCDTCSGFSFFTPPHSSSPLISSLALVWILLRLLFLLVPDLVVRTGEGSELCVGLRAGLCYLCVT